MQDGATIHNGYALDLDTISVGTRIGMMRCSDGTLHFFRDGVDQGVACTDIPAGELALSAVWTCCEAPWVQKLRFPLLRSKSYQSLESANM